MNVDTLQTDLTNLETALAKLKRIRGILHRSEHLFSSSRRLERTMNHLDILEETFEDLAASTEIAMHEAQARETEHGQ